MHLSADLLPVDMAIIHYHRSKLYGCTQAWFSHIPEDSDSTCRHRRNLTVVRPPHTPICPTCTCEHRAVKSVVPTCVDFEWMKVACVLAQSLRTTSNKIQIRHRQCLHGIGINGEMLTKLSSGNFAGAIQALICFTYACWRHSYST